MVTKTTNMPADEPEQRKFEKPSEGEHLLQVVDIIDNNDPNIVVTKLEVVGGDEEGNSMLHRVSLDENWKGFFLTRLFLKAVGESYKGDGVRIDSDNWIGRQFYATVIHNTASNSKVYANIDTFNFEKTKPVVLNQPVPQTTQKTEEEKAWDE